MHNKLCIIITNIATSICEVNDPESSYIMQENLIEIGSSVLSACMFAPLRSEKMSGFGQGLLMLYI